MTDKTTMNSPIARLGIGPMSREIVKAVYHYSHAKQQPLMLIASKNQVDHDRGYVMTTAQLRSYADNLLGQYPKALVYLCRDHCGPGFNGSNDLRDVYRTIDSDVENGFSLIHVDMCHLAGSYEEKLRQSKLAIIYILNKSMNTLIEIGTDENTGQDFEDLRKIEQEMSFFYSFSQPHFFVSQTGSLIKEFQQIGHFHKNYIDQVKDLADQHGLHLKEHNADYLPAAEIKKRAARIGAVNVAPQFGVIQSLYTLQQACVFGLDSSKWLADAYSSQKWQKWLHTANAQDKLRCAIVAGHYAFDMDSYRKLVNDIDHHASFYDGLEKTLFANFDLYLDNLVAVETPNIAAAEAKQ